ncbi:hypothetical protein NP511_17775 [Natrinema thermotolerans]|uniref:Uncharacterized protein n=1 Tax=Natrinema thermotolerans TaxID=121872 RepID=A0AAF0PD22_9EURY|nr:hypothetical protein [Natrinema thermotolerans]QCC60209.1 hypothetical protein DVR14_16865 [Natrinema thermotolerans]QCC61119.1 hypothetical protein DVR14_20985 [Natrinema thermotolerans]WMT07224.1 hypothetical protein NP511_17775 [Natrinema thermotolerans]
MQKNTILPMMRKMSIQEVEYLLQLIEEELEDEESTIWRTKVLLDEGTTKDEVWDLIWDLDEDFARSLESGWEDRDEMDEGERKIEIEKRHMRIRDI